MIIPFSDLHGFIDWYYYICAIRTFWTKPVRDIEIIYEHYDPILWILNVNWNVRSRRNRALLIINNDLKFLFSNDNLISFFRNYGGDLVLFIPENLFNVDLLDRLNVNARSFIYFWSLSSINLLEPNWNVDVKFYDCWNDDLEGDLRFIQKRSWGFYIPPNRDLHLIFIGYLNGKPVGSAYFNWISGNIDFGVHVVRDFWRNRIGTRILFELLNFAGKMNFNYVSVIRVFRRIMGSSSDFRARSFYLANNPSFGFEVLRFNLKR